MHKRKLKTNKKNTFSKFPKSWLSRSGAKKGVLKPILFGVFIALFVGPASWMIVHAQSGTTGIASIDEHSAAAANQAKHAKSKHSATVTPQTSAGATATTHGQTVAGANGSKPVTGSSTSGAAGAAKGSTAQPPASAAKPKAAPAPPAAPTPVPVSTASHDGITSTVFWVGEPADASNANITNAVSAWDESWQAHFGGVDDPNSRNGYAPAAFAPKENPFYFALPYSDFTDSGSRKSSAGNCPNAAAMAGSTYSWCKNAWIKITHAGKTTYAQWQDVGPLQEDDTAYVFGGARPLNTWGAKAGIDVSPAVRDYLGLQDVDTVSWSFVSANNVPAGAWRQVITTSLGT